MSDQTTVRPRPGTTYRDLPPSPPIGASPPAAPSPPVAPPPPAGSDPSRRRVWPWLAGLALVVGGVVGLLLWSPWTADADENLGFGADDGGSIFREADPFSGDFDPAPAPEDFNEGPGSIDDFLREFGGPEGFNFDDPQEFLDRLDEFGLENFGQLFGEDIIPPELLEDFGLPEDFLDRLREGDLGGLLDQLPEGLRDRLESFEGFDDGFRFNFSTDDFELGYLPAGYRIASVRFQLDGDSIGSRATIVATGPEGDIVATLSAGGAADDFAVPAGSDPVEMSGATAALSDDGDRRTLYFATSDGELAGTIAAPSGLAVSELVRIAEGVRGP